jgi:formylglycine-generating enzyme
MTGIDIYFAEINYTLPLTFVKGTGGATYLFGDGDKADIHVNDFLISKFQITQQLWDYIMGNNPSYFGGQDRPVENVSFNDITKIHGFLDKLNITTSKEYKLTFRLPSETEWEYAARGGPNWTDDFQFSGSNDINDVGWYDQNSGKFNDIEILSNLKNHEKGTTTRSVGQKQPNQLGVFDMSGNVWEWCQDYFQSNIQKIPKDGTANLEDNNERVLRGGCHHNWAIHCTVSKRYAIVPDAKDECIGFRIVASMNV